MRRALISDIHANKHALQSVLEEIDRCDVDDILCLGDVVGYGGDVNACIEIIRERCIITLEGNHDRVASGNDEPVFFSDIARVSCYRTREILSDENREWLSHLPEQITLDENAYAHSSRIITDRYIRDERAANDEINAMRDAGMYRVFVGHTHIPCYGYLNEFHFVHTTRTIELKKGEHLLCNPGSVGQPRDRNPYASFGIIDTDENTFSFHRVSYDIERAQKKIYDIGMPALCATRLAKGE